MELSEDVRRALGLAMQILEDRPDELRPHSNISDMKQLLSGQSSGRDGIIITEALATALAFLTLRAITDPANPHLRIDVFNARLHEFEALFKLVGRVDAWTFAVRYVYACERLGEPQ